MAAGKMKSKDAGSAMALATPDRVVVRGVDLCRDLIGRIGFTEYFLLLLLGERPSSKLIAIVDATLVAIAEHGMVPSVQAARMTLAAAPDALQGAVAAGLLGCGEVILGAAASAGQMLVDLKADVDSGQDVNTAVDALLTAKRLKRMPLPGFGHPLHKPEDPRAWQLIEYARELQSAAIHVTLLEAIHTRQSGAFGRTLPLNVSGAIAAVLLDASFPLEAIKGIPLVARAAGLVAHLLEERYSPIGFKLADAGAASVTYTGPLPPAAPETRLSGREIS